MESQLNLSVGAAAASTHRIPIERLPIVFGNDSHPNASTSNRNINAREILVSVETESINSGKLLFNWISGTKHHIKELINLKVNILDLFRSFRIFKTIRTLFELLELMNWMVKKIKNNFLFGTLFSLHTK